MHHLGLTSFQGVDVDAISARLTASPGTKVLKTFKSDVFLGLSVESVVENIDSLQGFKEIAKAWPMRQIELEPTQPAQVFSNDLAASNYSVHKWTGVDKAHAAGIYGKGVKIAIVDTGIDYTHPTVSS